MGLAHSVLCIKLTPRYMESWVTATIVLTPDRSGEMIAGKSSVLPVNQSGP